MTTIYLEPKDVPQTLRGSYTGKKFAAEVCEYVSIPTDAGLWSGGSRDHYFAVALSTGLIVPLPGQDSAPWDGGRISHKVTLKPDFALVRHTIFCGKDLGLTFFLHPANAASFLPAKVDLSHDEHLVLKATRSYKSSYAGRDRYQMAQEDARIADPHSTFPSREQWEVAKASLIAGGFLTRAGAITPKGRNGAAG